MKTFFNMLFFLQLFTVPVFGAQEEAKVPECTYAGVDQFCQAFWRNPFQTNFFSLSPTTQDSIRLFVGDRSIVRALADKKFSGNSTDRQNFIEACDRFHAFFKFRPYMQPSDFFEKQLSIGLLLRINGAILRSRPKTGTLQERLLNMYLNEQRALLIHTEIYDPTKDEINLDAYKDFMRGIENFDKLAQKMEWHLLPGSSFTPDCQEIDRWATEQGRTNTLFVSEWLKKYGEKADLKPFVDIKLNELFASVAMQEGPPIKKALFLFMGLSHIRPFLDGNKRTARLTTELMFYCYGWRLNRVLDEETPEYARFISAIENPQLSDEELEPHINEIGDFFGAHGEKISLGRCWLLRDDKCCSDLGKTGQRPCASRLAYVLGKHPRVTEFPPFFLQHPTLNGSITFTEEDLPLEKARARQNQETRIAIIKSMYGDYWEQTRHLETYDWLSAVTGLSSAFQDEGKPSFKLLVDINTVLLRSTQPDAGKFRVSDTLWNWGLDGDVRFSKTEISFAELVVKMYLFTTKKQGLIDKGVYADGLIYTERLKEIIRPLVTDELLRKQFLGTVRVVIGDKEVAPVFDDAEIDSWASEQGRTGSFYLKPWLSARSFVFPDRDRLGDYLQELLAIVRAEKSGFYKAVTLLLGLIDLHPFVDGNKRTAVVFASMILMQHGLSPLIFNETGEKLMNEYIVAPRGSVKKRMKAEELVRYIIAQIRKYQPDMKAYLKSLIEQQKSGQVRDDQKKKVNFTAFIEKVPQKSTGVNARAAVRSVETGQPLETAMESKTDPYKKKKTARPRKKKKKRKK